MVTELSPFWVIDRPLDRFMDDFFRPVLLSQRRETYPLLNISEDDANMYVECEIPGTNLNEIDITLVDSTLTIKGEKKTCEGKYYRQERASGIFQRVLNINIPVNRDAVKATFKDGILEITLPKAEEVKPKKISIDVV